MCTDLIYAFAILNEYTYEIQINDVWVDIDNRGYADFVALKLQNPNLRTTIALGGWNDSHFAKKYSEMVASNETRAAFITSVVKFLQLHNFDGLDFDWEYPSSDSDKTGLANLLRELRSAFETQYTLSVAVAANTTIIEEGSATLLLSKRPHSFKIKSLNRLRLGSISGIGRLHQFEGFRPSWTMGTTNGSSRTSFQSFVGDRGQ